MRKENLKTAGLIALIAVMVIGIKLIFALLDAALPHAEVPPEGSIPSSAVQQEPDRSGPAPSFCIFCGERLPESFQWGQYCPYCGEKVE